MSVAHQGDRVNKPFKCDLCEFSSHAKKYLKAHIFNCHEKDKYQCECDQCGKKFPFPHVLREHKEVEHDGEYLFWIMHPTTFYFFVKIDFTEKVDFEKIFGLTTFFLPVLFTFRNKTLYV